MKKWFFITLCALLATVAIFASQAFNGRLRAFDKINEMRKKSSEINQVEYEKECARAAKINQPCLGLSFTAVSEGETSSAVFGWPLQFATINVRINGISSTPLRIFSDFKHVEFILDFITIFSGFFALSIIISWIMEGVYLSYRRFLMSSKK